MKYHRINGFRKCAPGLRLLLVLVCLATGLSMSAQTDPMLTQYWAMPQYYNAGAAGSTDYVRIRAAGRLQWIGIENAPKSFIGQVDSPLKLFGKKIGLGANVTAETLGLFTNTSVGVQVAYGFKLFKGRLSVGVQPGFFLSNFKGTEVYIPDGDDYHQSTDPSIPTQDLTGNAFDLGVGLWYEHKLFNVGIGAKHLTSPKISLRKEGSSSGSGGEEDEYQTEAPTMFYFNGNCNIPLKNTLFELQPSLLLQSDFKGFSGAVTMRATYSKFLQAGIGYRWNDAVSVMVGAEFKNFFLGYSYDIPVSAIGKGTSGSHELVAGYRLKLDFSGKNRNKHRSIRLM